MATCFGVDGRVRLEVVDRPTDAPGPGADGAPFIRVWPDLAFPQRQSDDPFGPAIGPIWLNVGVAQRGISPTAAQDLAHGVKASAGTTATRWRSGLTRCRRWTTTACTKGKSQAQEQRHRLVGLDRQIDGQVHSRSIRPIAHRADHALHDGRALAGACVGFGHPPGHRGCARRYAAIDLALVELQDLTAALRAPHFAAGDALAALHHQRIGQRVRRKSIFAVVRHVPGCPSEPNRIAARVSTADVSNVVGIPACARRRVSIDRRSRRRLSKGMHGRHEQQRRRKNKMLHGSTPADASLSLQDWRRHQVGPWRVRVVNWRIGNLELRCLQTPATLYS